MGAGVYPMSSIFFAPTASAILNMPPTLSVLRMSSKSMIAIMVYTAMNMEYTGRKGSIHPVTSLISEVIGIFRTFGYAVALGPELEKAYYNFEALNIPDGHPAQEMWDTFWIKGRSGELLRTHTSPVQVRYMEKHKPPVRVVVPGKVFRNEATDATHEVQFYHIEGLCVTEDASLAQMKGVLDAFLRRIFGEDVITRYRPSFFPFTEPSLEVDMKRREDDAWLEVLGCGMVHKRVLKEVGIDPQQYCGFAFGIGVDRIVMLRHGIDDIRSLYTGDLRLVNQF